MAAAIGIDLCSDYTAVHIYGNEEAVVLPTVICRDRDTEHFSIGEEAYRKTLKGDGVLVDKLLRLAARRGTATIGGTCYEGRELLSIFLKKAVRAALPNPVSRETEGAETELVITLSGLQKEWREAVLEAAKGLQIPEEHIHIIGHTEAMMYYVLNGPKELYNNAVALFNLSEEKLFYYELQVIRGMQKATVLCEGEPMDEGFSLDILKSEAGRKLGDSILLGCGEKLMAKKNYSSVFLTGKGFEDIDFFPQFKEFICRRRRACVEKGLFAHGASTAAFDRTRPKSAFPYVFICESRLGADISLNVVTKHREERLLLAAAGDPWAEASGRISLIPYRQNYVDIDIRPVGNRQKPRTVRIPLTGFPERPDRCTQVSLEISFPEAHKMKLCLRDEGMGELFPKTDACIYEEIEI